MKMKKYTWISLRLVMGLMFLWAFFDKLLGLGFATEKANAWLNGASPTAGFLSFGTRGPFAEFFQSMVGIGVYGVNIIDWLFMLGLLGVGLALVFNKLVFWGGVAGALIMFLIYLAALPPEHNPVFDDHLVQVLVFLLIALKAKDNYRSL